LPSKERSLGKLPNEHRATEDGAKGQGVFPAWRSLRSWAFFLSVAAAGIVADLVSKHAVFNALADEPGKSVNIVGRIVRFTPSINTGIVFGIQANRWVVFIATLVAVVAVIVIFLTSSHIRRGLHISLAMILAGAVGNGFDRVFYRVQLPGTSRLTGAVRDFIDIRIGGFEYPTFNVADILIVVGIGLVFIQTLRQRR